MSQIGQMFMLGLVRFSLLLFLRIFNVLHGDTNDLVRMGPLLEKAESCFEEICFVSHLMEELLPWGRGMGWDQSFSSFWEWLRCERGRQLDGLRCALGLSAAPWRAPQAPQAGLPGPSLAWTAPHPLGLSVRSTVQALAPKKALKRILEDFQGP